MERLASTALQELIQMIEGRPPVMRTVLPVELLVRESSGPPPSNPLADRQVQTTTRAATTLNGLAARPLTLTT